MPKKNPTHSLIKPWWQGVLLGLLVLATALPWLRNHNYIRDFMDYGLVMSAVGRMENGEAPYRDFVTPIQAGFLQLNRMAEWLGGGDYIGLTYGGLALILIATVGLTRVLNQRWHPIWAVLFAAGVTVGTASQHNIIWHNSLGVICLAFATWSAACAPRWERAHWPWHIVLALALWVGGINKISFHLLTVVGCTGFIVRDLWLRGQGLKASGALLGWVLGFGFVVPLGTELLMTGADFATWHANVFALAGSSRAEYLQELLGLDGYLRPLHDYYGPLPIPQFGLWFIISLGGLATILTFGRGSLDRIMLWMAALGCMVATNALLATNHEIAYVAGAACIALGVALLLAFNVEGRQLSVALGWIGLFALINGIPAWRSAWIGERSQFGHSPSIRAEYVELAALDQNFEYLRGVLIPPEIADSYTGISHFMPEADSTGLHPAFYATGVEWLERIWPTIKVRGLPLWMHDGTSYQREQSEMLNRLIMPPSRFEILIASVPWDVWPGQSHAAISLFTDPHESGSALRVYTTQESLHADNDQIRLINLFGANFEPHLLSFHNTVFQLSEDGQIFFGTYNREPSTVGLNWRGSRAEITGVMRRLDRSGESITTADFYIEYQVDGVWHLIEHQTVSMDPEETQKTFSIAFDGRQRELRFRAQVSSDSAEGTTAGWFAPKLLHSQPLPGPPPPLMREVAPESPVTSERIAAFNHTDWVPDEVFLRGGEITPEGYQLKPGDQIWLKANHPLQALNGRIAVPSGDWPGKRMPLVRVLWYKGGRVQIAWQDRLNPESRSHHFHSWSAGPEGWIGILVDALPDVTPITVEITEVIAAP